MDEIDREHLRKVFTSLSTDAGRAFDKIDDSRRSEALYRSALAAWSVCNEDGDHIGTLEWFRICESLLK